MQENGGAWLLAQMILRLDVYSLLCCGMPRFLAGSPTLRAHDVKGLAEWYRDKLGFEIRLLWDNPVTYAIVRRDAVAFGIAQRDAQFGPVSVYIVVEDVESLYSEFQLHSASIHRELDKRDYEMMDFDLFDPEGNRFCFGEPIE